MERRALRLSPTDGDGGGGTREVVAGSDGEVREVPPGLGKSAGGYFKQPTAEELADPVVQAGQAADRAGSLGIADDLVAKQQKRWKEGEGDRVIGGVMKAAMRPTDSRLPAPSVGRQMHAFSELWEGARPATITRVHNHTSVGAAVLLNPDDVPALANGTLLFAMPSAHIVTDDDATRPERYLMWPPFVPAGKTPEAPSNPAIGELRTLVERMQERLLRSPDADAAMLRRIQNLERALIRLVKHEGGPEIREQVMSLLGQTTSMGVDLASETDASALTVVEAPTGEHPHIRRAAVEFDPDKLRAMTEQDRGRFIRHATRSLADQIETAAKAPAPPTTPPPTS